MATEQHLRSVDDFCSFLATKDLRETAAKVRELAGTLSPIITSQTQRDYEVNWIRQIIDTPLRKLLAEIS